MTDLLHTRRVTVDPGHIERVKGSFVVHETGHTRLEIVSPPVARFSAGEGN